jgi:hypothetical protein
LILTPDRQETPAAKAAGVFVFPLRLSSFDGLRMEFFA